MTSYIVESLNYKTFNVYPAEADLQDNSVGNYERKKSLQNYKLSHIKKIQTDNFKIGSQLAIISPTQVIY